MPFCSLLTLQGVISVPMFNDVIIYVPMFFVVRFQNFGRFAFLLPQVTVSTGSSNFGYVCLLPQVTVSTGGSNFGSIFASHKCLHTSVGPN